MDCSSVILYIAALVLGMCCLFGYNSFLASPSYMEHYFQYAAVKNTNDVSTLPKAKNSGFWDDIATWVLLIMLIPMFICQILMLTPCMLKLNLQVRLISGCIGLIIAMLIVPVCSASGGVSEGGAMAVIIIGAALAGFSTTFLQSSLFALFGTLPGSYMGGFVLGGGFSGSVNSVLRIIITAASPSTFSGIKNGAVIFFSIGMALMVVTMIIVLLLRLHPIVREFCTAYKFGDIPKEDLYKEDECIKEMSMHDAQALDIAKVDVEATGEHAGGVANEVEEYIEDASAIGVIKKIWWMMICLMLTMMTTLALFPGIGLHAMQTESDDGSDASGTDNGGWQKEKMMPIVIILMYNVGDTIGRLLANFRILWIPQRHIHWIVFARIIVCTIPLALGAAPSKIINSNANPIVIFLVLGLTNGYVIGLTMAYGSGDKRLKSEAEKGTAGTVMCFSLLTGMTIGSVLSTLVVTFAF